jgi:hypothetical protein
MTFAVKQPFDVKATANHLCLPTEALHEAERSVSSVSANPWCEASAISV